MRTILLTTISLLICNLAIGQISIAPHFGIFNNENKITSDTGAKAFATKTPTLTYGIGIGYAFENLILELDISAMELETGISFLSADTAIPLELVLGSGPNNLNSGFTSFGLNFKYNLLPNKTFQLTPLVGAAIVHASGYQKGVNSSGFGTSGRDGKTVSAEYFETSYTGKSIVQLTIGSELAVKISENFSAYLVAQFNIATSNQFETEAKYEIGTEDLKNLTSKFIMDNLDVLSETATSVSNFDGLQTSLGVRYSFSLEKKPAKI